MVATDVWDRVQQFRMPAARPAGMPCGHAGVGIAHRPAGPGVAVKYPLSGLVVCGRCGLSIAPSSSLEYTTKGTGEDKRYTAYHCGRSADRICPNAIRVPEAWLREAVLGLVRDRLLYQPHRPGRTISCRERTGSPRCWPRSSANWIVRRTGNPTGVPPSSWRSPRLEKQIAEWKMSSGTRDSVPRSAGR